jgi:hypothetical protein
MNPGFNKSFIWKISICSGVAYLLATMPQIIIDPLLEHDVNFSSRRYPHALYYVIPLCAVVFLGTYQALKRSRTIIFDILPFLAAALLSIPLFTPEIPNGNLFATSFIWLTLVILTLWIRNRELATEAISRLQSTELGDKTAKIEYLKEQVQFWRTVLLGIAGGYLALLISWANFLIGYNKAQVGGNEAETYILNQAALFAMGLYSVGLMICPLAEASQRHREATNLFLNIKEKEM